MVAGSMEGEEKQMSTGVCVCGLYRDTTETNLEVREGKVVRALSDKLRIWTFPIAHYQWFGLANSLSWGTELCIVGPLAASLASTR